MCGAETPRGTRAQAVEGKERALRERGAAWNPPTLTAALRALPFMGEVSDALFEEIVLQVRCRAVSAAGDGRWLAGPHAWLNRDSGRRTDATPGGSSCPLHLPLWSLYYYSIGSIGPAV